MRSKPSVLVMRISELNLYGAQHEARGSATRRPIKAREIRFVFFMGRLLLPQFLPAAKGLPTRLNWRPAVLVSL